MFWVKEENVVASKFWKKVFGLGIRGDDDDDAYIAEIKRLEKERSILFQI